MPEPTSQCPHQPTPAQAEPPQTNVFGRVSTPWQLPWPDNCIARYWTVAGATVDLTGSGNHVYARCTGCPFGHAPGVWWHEARAHELAQGHAEKCRALPRPTQ